MSDINDNQIIEVKEEVVVDSFTLKDLKDHIALIDSQINNIAEYCGREISELEEERVLYQQKIVDFGGEVEEVVQVSVE